MNTANYISVQSFKDYNPGIDTSQYTDTTISGMVSRASKWVDSFLGYSLASEAITNEITDGYIDSNGSLLVFTKKIPIISVEAIDLIFGADEINLSLTDGSGVSVLNIPENKTRIIYPGAEFAFTGGSTLVSFWDLRGTPFFSRVDYTAGYIDIPGDILDAVNLLVRDIISRNINPAGATRIQQGAISYAFETGSGESDNIKDAKMILNNYQRMAMIG